MSFTVYGEHPGSGGHWEFARETAAGAVLKAADLISDGWTGVHISDDKEQNLLARSVSHAAHGPAARAPLRCRADEGMPRVIMPVDVVVTDLHMRGTRVSSGP
jgi:hypothetical protein